MNENSSTPILTRQNNLQKALLDDICQIVSDATCDSEKVSKEKYEIKLKLIESAMDMSTQEKLDAMDKNYDCWNQEHWQNILTSAVVSFSVLGFIVVSPIAINAMRKINA
ncbi:MAG: hypothetical protein HFI38_14290 [Lachnospiraceae bacterium]|jgi:hypothetical protein|nr:hypothetical protein [Lachnospiraceae bacterium]